MNKERNIGIDICKAFCAFLVICIHCPLYGRIGEYVCALSRIAVPIFFMISGYFWNDVLKRDKSKNQIRKILILIIISNIMYLLWGCAFSVISGNNLIQYFKRIFSMNSIIKFVMLNESPVGSHLWYLNAILYTEILFILLHKLASYKMCREEKKYRMVKILIPILLIVDLIFGKYSLLIFGCEFDYLLVRNYLFVGIPYFSIGLFIKNRITKDGIVIDAKKLSMLTIIISILAILERFILVKIGMNATRDHYICTTLLAIVIFVLFIKVYDHRKHTAIEKIIAKIGNEYSSWIYIIHPIFITIYSYIANKINVIDIWRLGSPIIVFVTSILVILFFKIMLRIIKNDKSNEV